MLLLLVCLNKINVLNMHIYLIFHEFYHYIENVYYITSKEINLYKTFNKFYFLLYRLTHNVL